MDQRRNTDHDSSRRTSRRVTRRRTSDRPATDQRRGIGDQRCTTRRMIRPSDGRAMHDQTDDQTIRRTSNARPEQMDQRRTNDTLTHDSTRPATDEQTDKQTEQRRTGSRDDQWQSNRQTSGRKEETDKRCMSSRSTTMANDARTADQPRMSKPATMTPVDRAATEQRRANGYNRSGQTSDRRVTDQ